MKSRNRRLALAWLCAAVATVGCGKKETIRESNPQPPPVFGDSPGQNPGTPPSDGGGYTPASGPPPLSFNFSGTGQDSWTSGTFSTDNLLKVRIIPSTAGQNSIPGYTNYNGAYSCIKWRVGVRIGGVDVGAGAETKTLAVNNGSFACPGAPSEQVIDLSGVLTAGHPQDIQVTIGSARYDYYCQMCYYFYSYFPTWQNPFYPYGCNSYCPLRTVYQYHTWNGELRVQTNGLGGP